MSAAVCYRHPTRLAVEHCEQCRRPVCGSCLWYAESGERLCPDHAADFLKAGQTVTPPERYADGIVHSEASAAQPAGVSLPYQGNATDLNALVAGVIGVSALLTCVGQAWLLPFLAEKDRNAASRVVSHRVAVPGGWATNQSLGPNGPVPFPSFTIEGAVPASKMNCHAAIDVVGHRVEGSSRGANH